MTTRRERLSLRNALVELARLEGPSPGSGPVADVLGSGLADELVDASLAHDLAAPLQEALKGASWEGNTEALERELADHRLRRVGGLSTLAQYGEALDEEGLGWVAVSGPVVASFLPRPEVRSFNAIDLLVAGRDLRTAIDALVDTGATEINKNWQGCLDVGAGGIPLQTPLIDLDLHWHLIGTARMRRRFALDIDAMLERRRRVRIGGAEISALDAADQVIHVALHSAFSGRARLDQLRDVAALAANDEIDWKEVARRARAYRAARMVGHTLDRAAEVLGAAVPPEVRADLTGWTRHVRRRRDRRPPRRLTGDVGGPVDFDIDAGGSEARAAYLAYAASGYEVTFGSRTRGR